LLNIINDGLAGRPTSWVGFRIHFALDRPHCRDEYGTVSKDRVVAMTDKTLNVSITETAAAGDLSPVEMRPADYVQEIVLPTMREFSRERRSRRLAYLACMTVFHIKDHLLVAGETSVKEKMRSATDKEFDVVRAICNGTKHPKPDNRNSIRFVPGEDFDRPPAEAALMEAGVSRAGDTVGGREIGSDPSERYDIYDACRVTLKAFCGTFSNHLGHCDLSGL
jgi:hypothetical protein